MAFIEIDKVSKAHGSGAARAEVLGGIDFRMEEGEFTAIVGYSGSGKTTLINLLAGLTAPDSGTVKIDGRIVSGPSPERALVFQNYSLLPWLTVSGNIALAVDAVFPAWTKEQRAAHVAEHVAMVKLTHAAGRYPRELSGGMRQRVALARALAMKPRVLLMDEPLSALDALTRAVLQDEISAIWERSRTTVVWITNDPDEAILVADRVIPLLPGRPASLGEPMAVTIDRPRDRRAVNSDPRFKELRAQLVGTLLDARGRGTVRTSRKLTLPDILPEDLTKVDSLQFFVRRGPRRRSETRREEVEVLP